MSLVPDAKRSLCVEPLAQHQPPGPLEARRTANEYHRRRPPKAVEQILPESCEVRKWKSKEAAHSPPAKDRPSILPARCALTPCSRPTLRHARLAPVSRSSPAL